MNAAGIFLSEKEERKNKKKEVYFFHSFLPPNYKSSNEPSVVLRGAN